MQSSHSNSDLGQSQSLFAGVTFYHWLVVIIASCGWLFDCMDQRLFILARESALRELLGDNAEAQAQLKTYIGYATTAMILGWATGGIFFGMMSDKVGRVKTMVATLLVYSGFTGLSGFAVGGSISLSIGSWSGWVWVGCLVPRPPWWRRASRGAFVRWPWARCRPCRPRATSWAR
jgi:MFS family permease